MLAALHTDSSERFFNCMSHLLARHPRTEHCSALLATTEGSVLQDSATMPPVIVIDDDDDYAPVPTKRRRKAPAQQDYVDLVDSSDDGEEPTPRPAKRGRKKAADPFEDVNEEDSSQGVKQKKPRKAKQPKEPKEKRTNEYGATVRYAAQPSQAVYQRIQRALPGSGHRMFLISTKQLAPAGAPEGRAQEFVVLGATGNVYTVKISRHPHCNCPDHDKGNLCKHILFVMLRVLKLSTTNPLVWQRALLTQEVEEILSGAHSQGVDAGVIAEDGVLRAYMAASGQAAGGAAAAGSSVDARKPVEGDCPICFNELKEGAEPLVWCKSSCGNNMHKQCFDKWAAAKRGNGQPVTCVYCRAVWSGDGAQADPAAGNSSYLNLAQHSHEYDANGTSLEALYGDSAVWINYHSQGYSGGRRGAAATWRSGFGRRR